MLYRTLKRMIARGQTAGLEEKVDLFFAADKLGAEEYRELLALLREGATAGEVSGNGG